MPEMEIMARIEWPSAYWHIDVYNQYCSNAPPKLRMDWHWIRWTSRSLTPKFNHKSNLMKFQLTRVRSLMRFQMWTFCINFFTSQKLTFVYPPFRIWTVIMLSLVMLCCNCKGQMRMLILVSDLCINILLALNFKQKCIQENLVKLI